MPLPQSNIGLPHPPIDDPAMYSDPQATIEALRQRGQLAQDGAFRAVPLQPQSGAPVNTMGNMEELLQLGGKTGQPTPPGAGPGPGEPVVVKTKDGNTTTIDPKNLDPAQVEQIDESEWPWLLPLLSGAAGAAIATMLANRRKGGETPRVPGQDVGAPNAPPGSPSAGPGQGPRTGPGGTPLEPDYPHGGALPAPDIIEGEFTEVPGQRRLQQHQGVLPPGQTDTGAALLERQLALPRPAPGLPSPETIPPNPSESELAEQVRQRRLRQHEAVPVDTRAPPAAVVDKLSDLTPEERAFAYKTASELVERRRLGNTRRLKGGKGTGRKNLPTSPGLQTEDPVDMLGHVVRMIREGKIKPSQVIRAIP